MKLKNVEILFFCLVVIAFIIGLYFYPILPERVASHWNINGEVNGYMNRFWGAFLMPIVISVMFLVFFLIPRIDPKKENIEKFRLYFDRFIILLFIFMIYIYGLTLAWNLGHTFNMTRFLFPAIAVLFYYSGILIQHAKMNWTIGIRTPWTLSDQTVWDKTHRLGAKLFKGSGIIALLGIFLPYYAVWVIIVPIIASAIWLIVYSYLEYNKLH